MSPLRYVQAGLSIVCVITLVFLLSKSGSLFTKKDLRCLGCNVILISIDTLGANHTSLYDSTLDTTPFLKSLGAKSVVFDNAYSQAPWTLPSHTAMLTGLYPWDLNIWLPSDVLPKDALTIAEQLKDSGYHTTAFSDGPFVRPGWQFDQGFDEFYGSVAEADWKDVPKILTDSSKWISSYTNQKPYFLFIHSFEVHDPYAAQSPDGVTIKDIAAENLRFGGPSQAANEVFKERHYEEIRKTDAALKAFFDDLTKKGTLANTIIIITSDHGEEFAEHGTSAFHAVTAYREVLHVPLLITTPAGRVARVPSSVEIRSIPSTILELAGLPKNYTMASSLAPYMDGVDLGNATVYAATALEREPLLKNFFNGYGATGLKPTIRTSVYQGPRTWSVIRGSEHAIKLPDDSEHVFDMSTDPGETTSLPRNEHVDILHLLDDLAHGKQ